MVESCVAQRDTEKLMYPNLPKKKQTALNLSPVAATFVSGASNAVSLNLVWNPAGCIPALPGSTALKLMMQLMRSASAATAHSLHSL